MGRLLYRFNRKKDFNGGIGIHQGGKPNRKGLLPPPRKQE
jgi:hypothetical protein